MSTDSKSKSDMRMKAIAPWFGAKRCLAATIIAELGPHSAYWEPFCGSMAVLLAKPVSSRECVCDLHGDLINLAKVIADPNAGPAMYRRLRRMLCCEQFMSEAKSRWVENQYGEDCVQRAVDFFVISWMGRSGISGTGKSDQSFSRVWGSKGGNGAKRYAAAVDSIPAWRRRLRFVNIQQRDGFSALERIGDQNGVAIYCDPPYLVEGARYMHDFTDDDHVRLAELLMRFKHARVVVSYYDHPQLDELYPGWTRRRIEVSKARAHSGHRGTNDTRAVEVLLMNGPSMTGETQCQLALSD